GDYSTYYHNGMGYTESGTANTLEGGTGIDQLWGSGGSDTYRYNLGDGADTINEVAYNNQSALDTGTDRIVLGAGIAPADVTVTRSNTDLVLKFANAGDQLTVAGWYSSPNNRIEQLMFADGTVWDRTTLHTAGLVQNGTAGSDTLYGLAGEGDVIDGLGGNDILNGGTGNDVYRFGLGSGQDTIKENDATPGNTDVAQFLAGISANQLWLRHVGNNLEVGVIGTTDKLTAENWYLGSAYHVEQFKTADNKLLLDTRVELLVQAMAAFAPPAAGQTTLPPNYQDALAPVIAANWQ
ncbi:calcium-binding protein, partial [Propionivibrio sp.]|uniref:calcium-binding protein n=1 Tax=Propionivibrio sp. TaxID=2212460 RepID=UPI0026143F8A